MSCGRAEKLYVRAISIRESGGPGCWLPIIEALASRGHPEALVELADWRANEAMGGKLGRLSSRSQAAGLYKRAYAAGEARGAANLAVSFFNRNDLARYRYWLRKAADKGDDYAARELSRFELRLPHSVARKVRRKRPWAKRDET